MLCCSRISFFKRLRQHTTDCPFVSLQDGEPASREQQGWGDCKARGEPALASEEQLLLVDWRAVLQDKLHIVMSHRQGLC